MGSVGDVYQVKLFQTLLNVDVLNVWYYILETQGTGSNLASVLAGEFDTDIIPPLTEIQTTDLTYTQLEVVNLGLLTEFSATPGSGLSATNGVRGGQVLPAFFCASFRYQRAAIGQRYGYKRIAGIQDQDVDGDGIESGRTTDYTAVATAFAAVLDDGAGNTWAPYIARRPITLGVNPTGYVSKGVDFNGWTTQSTRKS